MLTSHAYPRAPPPSCFAVSSAFAPSRAQSATLAPAADPLQETGQHGAGTDLDKSGAIATDARRMLHALHPANWRRQLIRQQSTGAPGLLHRFGGGIRDHRECGIGELGARERELQMVLGRPHERRVECPAHFEGNDALGAALLAALARAGDGVGIAGDHRLVRGVDVGGDGEARLLRRLRARRFHVFGRKAEHRGHRAGALVPGLLHQLAAAPHELRRLGGTERARRDVGGVLAERMPSGRDNTVDLVAHDREHRGAVREDGGLRVLRRRQLLFRTLEHDPRQLGAEGFVDRVEHGARRGEPLREIFAHADFLRALPRAQPDGGRSMLRPYHRTTMLPQVKPAPKAQNITVMPGFRRPHVTASSSAMAMDAAEVLPKRSTLT